MTWQQTIEDEKEDAYEEGRAEGASQKAVEATKNLLKMGLGTYEQIAQVQGLPLEQVQEIAERLAVKV